MTAFSSSATDFALVSQHSLPFVDGIGRLDYSRLIQTPRLGRDVAKALGTLAVVVLKNHGLVVAAQSIEAAVVLAVSFERSLLIQAEAGRFGPLVTIDADEARAMAARLPRTRVCEA